MKSFDQRIYREEFRAKRQPKAKRGPYKCRGLTKDRKAYAAAYYRQRLKKGLCSHCGKPNQDRPGKTICGTCHERSNDQRQATASE